ncbi:MAG: hypothetical protein KF832_08365 [Caldilineaceae bacterium]|nr:hypothetical protein [Caldilineaceae bacterium]
MSALLVGGTYYHIYNRGNNRENIFREERNFRYFLELYAKHILPVADTYAYCLLRNHFHFLVRIKTTAEREAECNPNLTGLSDLSGFAADREPSQAFSNLFNAYTKAINKAYGRVGALFQRPFGRIVVTSDRYFRQLVVYIHQNPQKHGLVEDFRRWPYSSYPTLLSLQKTLLHRDEVLTWFSQRSGFLATHEQTVGNHAIELLTPDDVD